MSGHFLFFEVSAHPKCPASTQHTQFSTQLEYQHHPGSLNSGISVTSLLDTDHIMPGSPSRALGDRTNARVDPSPTRKRKPAGNVVGDDNREDESDDLHPEALEMADEDQKNEPKLHFGTFEADGMAAKESASDIKRMRESKDAVSAQPHINAKRMYEAVLGQAYATAGFSQAPGDARPIQDPLRPADGAGVSVDHHTMTGVSAMDREPTVDEQIEMDQAAMDNEAESNEMAGGKAAAPALDEKGVGGVGADKNALGVGAEGEDSARRGEPSHSVNSSDISGISDEAGVSVASIDPSAAPALDEKDADVADGADGDDEPANRRGGGGRIVYSDDETGGKTGDKTDDVGSDDGLKDTDDESGGIKDAVVTPGVIRHAPKAKTGATARKRARDRKTAKARKAAARKAAARKAAEEEGFDFDFEG